MERLVPFFSDSREEDWFRFSRTAEREFGPRSTYTAALPLCTAHGRPHFERSATGIEEVPEIATYPRFEDGL